MLCSCSLCVRPEAEATVNTIRMLYFVRESYPTPRVDIEVLFGAELVRRGHQIDLVMQAADRRTLPGPQDWFGCTVWVGPTDDRDGAFARARKHWLSLLHDLRLLLRAGRDRYPSIQVRDKFLTAALALLAARLRGQKFFYWLSYPQPEALLRAARERTARYPAVSLVRGLLSKWL